MKIMKFNRHDVTGTENNFLETERVRFENRSRTKCFVNETKRLRNGTKRIDNSCRKRKDGQFMNFSESNRMKLPEIRGL